MSVYGLGTWAMGGGVYGAADDAESERVIRRAEELGVSLIDTAPMYGIADRRDGRAERIVGRAIAGRRDRWTVATKYGRRLNGADDWEAMDCDFSAANCRRSVEQSLGRLGVDEIDILFVHSPFREDFDADDAFAGMQRLKEEGKIRAIGFSFLESIADTLPLVRPYVESGVVEVLQVKQSLLTPETDRLLRPLVLGTGVAVVAREALARGFLTASFGPDDPFGPDDWKSRLDRSLIRRELGRAAQFDFLIDSNRGVQGLAEAALNWVVSHPEVSSVIPGPRTVAELEQCLSAVDAAPYDEATMERVEAIRSKWDEA